MTKEVSSLFREPLDFLSDALKFSTEKGLDTRLLVTQSARKATKEVTEEKPNCTK